MAGVVWSERALNDISEIAEFIAKDCFQYATAQVSSFFEKVAQLENNPAFGRPVPELNEPAIRQLLCGSYRLIYELKNDQEISILTVHYQSRLLENNPAFKDKNRK